MRFSSPRHADRRSAAPAPRVRRHGLVPRSPLSALALAIALGTAAGTAQAAKFNYVEPPESLAKDTPTVLALPGGGNVTFEWTSPGDTFYEPDDEDFEGRPDYNNPKWVKGERMLFDTSAEDGPSSAITLSFSFDTGLQTNSYLVFADFENSERVSIRAYDANDDLIDYTAFLFQQWDGQEGANDPDEDPDTRGSELDYLDLMSPPAAGYSFQAFGKSGYNSWSDDLVWTLGFDTPIHRLVYEVELPGGGGAKFNFAVPEPTTLALLGAGLVGIGWRGRRQAV